MRIRRKTYYGGSLRYPVTITQKFWDEVTEHRRVVKEHNSKSGNCPMVDTCYGSDDLGERPSLPDWVYDAIYFIAGFISLVCLIIVVYVFKRGY